MEITFSLHKEDAFGYTRATGVVQYCDVGSKEELSVEVHCLVNNFVRFNFKDKIEEFLQKQAAVMLLDETECCRHYSPVTDL